MSPAFPTPYPLPRRARPPLALGLLLLALLVTAVAAPICEELFFRGMLFRLLRERTFLSVAVIVSGLAFGLAHASPAVSLALLPTFVFMGIVNLYVAFNYSEKIWATFKLFGGMGLMFLFVVAQSLVLAKYLQDESH